MVFSDDVLFLHPPKTGGMSVSRYLLGNLRGPLRFTVPKGLVEHMDSASTDRPDVVERLKIIDGRTHETLEEAVPVVESEGLRLEDFSVIFAVVRNPYDLEVSHFRYMPVSVDERLFGQRKAAVRLAVAGDFERFCKEAPFFDNLPSRIERYYTLDGEMPANFKVARFERLEEDVSEIVEPFSLKRVPLPHINSSPTDAQPQMTERAKRYIESKYEYLFNYYDRA